MGQSTTEAVRRAIQTSQESITALVAKYGINPKTVVKWKKRNTVQDAPMGPKEPASTVLTKAEKTVIVAFRKQTLVPLDDCLYTLQASLPQLTRSSLHRCLQRHGISRLPDCEGSKKGKKTFKSSPIDFSHIDITQIKTEEDKLHLFVAIDRTSHSVMAKLTARATMAEVQTFLEERRAAIPYTIHILLMDNGIQFADPTKNRTGPTAMLRGHPFDRVCRRQGIEH